MTVLEVQRGDITMIEVDLIVNAANSSLMGGGGVDGAIHRAGGPEILDACRAIVAASGGCATGDAVITTAGRLPAVWVVHTVGPVWSGTDPERHDVLLASAYTSSLDLAAEHGARTVSFPNISTGVYGFPKTRAADVAIGAVRSWVAEHPDLIDRTVFVCFDEDNEQLYRQLLAD